MVIRTGKIFHIIITTILLVFHLGCNQTNEATNFTPSNAPIQKIDTICAGDRDTTILLTNEEAFIKGHIRAGKAQQRYTLPAWKGQEVIAMLKSLREGRHVRIDKVQKPDGSFDGPFGDTLRYTVKSNGNIHFIIGENLMAGDSHTVDFMFHIIVK